MPELTGRARRVSRIESEKDSDKEIVSERM